MSIRHAIILLIVTTLLGCNTQEIPQAHKGRLFDKTGVLALYIGGDGFEGPVLGPGTHYIGLYPEIRMVDCSQKTVRESLPALTKDGVQFTLDIYVSFRPNCDDNESFNKLLDQIAPQPDPSDQKNLTITSTQVYDVYVRAALGEAVREAISPHIANNINANRDEIFTKIKESFKGHLSKLVVVESLNLSNMDFPDEMDHANTERAAQAVLKDKAIAERERVEAEIETTKMRNQLATSEANNEVARITAIGQALEKNPKYLQFDMQQKMPGIYADAAKGGGLIIAAPAPSFVMTLPEPMQHSTEEKK